MDFQSLSRRDLQSLCKKNKIPANLTNVAMADALRSLQSVDGLAEIQEALQLQSPKKLDPLSPTIPRTGRRAMASITKGAVEDDDDDGPKERQGSPLPRARRVTARAPEILSMVDAAEEKVPCKKDVPETPKVPNTRRKAGKKDEGGAEAPTGQKTVATRRRAEGKEVEKAAVGLTTGRRTRQLSKKEVSQVGDDLMSGGLKRSTRGRGRSAAISKMASLAKDEEEDQKKEAEDSVEQNGEEVAVNKEEEKEITEELDSKEQDRQSDKVLEDEDGCGEETTIQDEKQEKSSQESFGSEEESSEINQDQEGRGLLSGFDYSPIRGLITSDQATNNEQQENPPAEEIENAERSSEQEEAIATDDGELNPAETEDSGAQSPDLVACDQTDLTGQPLAAESKEPGEGNGENYTGGDDLSFSPANGEITAEATEPELTVESPIESPAKQPQEDDVTGEGNGQADTGGDDISFSPANGEITAEVTELELTIESTAIDSPAKQQNEDDVTGEGNREVDTGGNDLSFIPANCEIAAEATEPQLTVESPAKQPKEDDVTGEGNGEEDTEVNDISFSLANGEIAAETSKPELTVESPATESPAKQPKEDDVTGEGHGEADTEGDDLSFSPANREITAEATEPELTVESPAIESPSKQPKVDDATGESNGEADTGGNDLSLSPAKGEIDVEATELELSVESPAIESPAEQPKEDDVTGEGNGEADTGGNDLSLSPANGEIDVEASEPELTVESPAIESPAEQPNEDDVTGEGNGEADTGLDGLSFSPANCEIAWEATEQLTVEAPAIESPVNQPKEDDVKLDLGPADDAVAYIAAEVDESGADLSGNNFLTGEISVEAIGEEKPPSMQADIAGESMDEVLVELMDLSDLKLSAGSEPPVEGIYRERKGSDDKENGRLTESTSEAKGEVVGPIGRKKYEDMSLRKLKAAYKETLLSKGEEKRAALKAIDVNKDAAANIF